MDTPREDDFDTIIEEFNVALSRMVGGLGSPVTRSERAILKTFYIFVTETKGYSPRRSGQDERAHPLDDC